MAFVEPKNLHTAILPMIYFNWIVGMGLGRPPRSKLIHIMMILYSVGFYIFSAVVFYIGISAMFPSYYSDNSPMAIIMYQALVYTNAGVALVAPFLAWMRRKGINDCVERMSKLDDTLIRLLGIEKNYKRVVITQVYQIVIICFTILVITIIDTLWIQSEISLLTNCAVMLTFHHPIMLILVSDSTFCGSARWLGIKFRSMNTALIGLTELDVDSISKGTLITIEQKIAKLSSVQGIDNREAKNLMNKRNSLQTIRRAHLELSKIAGKLNDIYGIQNLLSMGISLVMITGLLYTIYIAFYWKYTIHDRIKEVVPPACWCIIYASKVIIVSHCCATVSNEAQKSGQIIYEVLGSADDREYQREIQEFGLQMIQNPVRFTACGFFTLDYTYVQGVIGSITTYLVILIQMSDAPSLMSISSANKSKT